MKKIVIISLLTLLCSLSCYGATNKYMNNGVNNGINNQQFNNFYIKLNNNWLTTTSYWTMTAKADTTDLLWGIHGESGNIYDYYPNANDIYGVRVKITSIKSNIVR